MTSTQRQISDPYNLMGRLPIQPVWRDPNKAKERIYQMRLKCPNPPTPEAIKRAQFVDKTYKWTGK